MKVLKTLDVIGTWIVVITLFVAALVYINGQYNAVPAVQPQNFSGVTVGNEYQATGTAPFGQAIVDRLVDEGRGTLGSVVVTKAGDAAFDLIDATSTRALSDLGQFATNTQILASIPASLAAGTYTFDVNYKYGLLLEVSAGDTGTSTIMYRK